MNLKDLPKIELHLHLDGSLNIEEVAKIKGISDYDARRELMPVKEPGSLSEYLNYFTMPIELLKSKDNINLLCKRLCDDLAEDNVLYAELRFAPFQHVGELSLEEVVASVIDASRTDRLKINIILCMMRNSSFEENKEIIDLAYKYLGKGVVAIDLAGDESKYETKDFERLFKLASKRGLPFTIHAGEAVGHESVDAAISFGAKRIGHGIKSLESLATIDKLIDKNIVLEICPTSNVQTGAVSSIKAHPLKNFEALGVMYTISTDNRAVSNISLSGEYFKLIDNNVLSLSEIIESNKTAINCSFLPKAEKEQLLYMYQQKLEEFLNSKA